MKPLRSYFAFIILIASSTLATAQPISNDNLRNSPLVLKAFREVVAKPSESVVRVQADGKDTALGTIVGADGWIVTKASELKGKITCKLKDGKSYDAKITGVSVEHDLALLHIDAKKLPAVFWRDSKEATVGKWVASVSTDKEPAAIGVVSVGTRLFKTGDQGPKNANSNAGWLGVALEESSFGAKINSVAPKSPAEAAGVRVGDLIVEAGGRKIIDNETLINTIQRFKPKDAVILKIKRGEEVRDVRAVLEALPKQFLGNPQERMGSLLSHRRGGFPKILQHDTVLKPVDCGGPLVDLDGKTVGINISRAGRTETYAIPSEDVIGLLTSLKSGDLAPKDDSKTDPLPVAPKKTTDMILRSAYKLTTNDKLDEDRPGLGANRHMKTEEVKLSAGVAYLIELTSPDFNSCVIVTDVKGNQLAEHHDPDGGRDARVTFTPKTAGAYRILVTTTQPNLVGSYTLQVRLAETTRKEPEEKKKN